MVGVDDLQIGCNNMLSFNYRYRSEFSSGLFCWVKRIVFAHVIKVLYGGGECANIMDRHKANGLIY